MKAAENDYTDAQYSLGNLYESGKLGTADYINAEKWYLKAALNDNAKALVNVCYLYDSGKLGHADYL